MSSARGYGSIDEHGRELELDAARSSSFSSNSSENDRSHLLTGRLVEGTIVSLKECWNRKKLLVQICIFGLVSAIIFGVFNFSSGSPADDGSTTPVFFKEQYVDHNNIPASGYYNQRYFEKKDLFGGPGHPIFVIMGGEDPLDGILYPFISQDLGRRFSAYTICIEHRFYGKSWPVDNPSNADLRRLLSPAQALEDAIRLVRHKQAEFGCGPKGTSSYCPVVTVGASYPGFLSALMRIVYPDVVDIGYASSAPLQLYDHTNDRDAYFDHITLVSDEASPGCADTVRKALMETKNYILNSGKTFDELAAKLGICPGTVPDYIDSPLLFVQELMTVVSTHFAENNMGYYPPGERTDLVQGCKAFQKEGTSSIEKVNAFLRVREDFRECFDMLSELPPGANGTISAADWSGVGDGPAGWIWDFQSCGLIPECSKSPSSMFPPREWTLEWLTEHCESRFGFTPDPPALVNEFHFDRLEDVTRLLFTNGLKDGWSVASILQNVSTSVLAINFPNGAHHSDLTHDGPTDADTDDIREGHFFISNLMADWLEEVRSEA